MTEERKERLCAHEEEREKKLSYMGENKSRPYGGLLVHR